MDITIFIPTKNREYYIKRTLKYYSKLNFKGQLIVLDSSDKDVFISISNFIKSITNIKIDHVKTKQLPLLAIKENINLVVNNFCSFMGDDDYLIPSGIVKSINFLKNNHNFHSAHGQGIIISKPLKSTGKYPGPELLSNNSYKRFKSHFTKYATPFFSVTRFKIFKYIFSVTKLEDDLNSCKDRLILDEYLYSGLYALTGRIKRLNFLHIVREHHSKRYDEKKNWENQITPSHTISSIEYFSKTINNELNKIEGNNFSNYQELQNLIKISVSNYYKSTYKRYNRKNDQKRNISIKAFLIFILKKIYLYKFIKYVKSIAITNEYSLENLLDKKNKNFNDFIIVYNSFNDKD